MKTLLFVCLFAACGAVFACGSKNYQDETEYVTCTTNSVSPSIVGGEPSTADALSRFQWAMRELLEGQSYSSLFADAPNDVVVAVIGTWPGHRNHPDLVNRYLPGINLVEGGSETSTSPDGKSPTGGNTHDQCAAGIIAAEHNDIGTAGVFHRAKILPIRASWATLSFAIDRAVTAGAQVIHIGGWEVPERVDGWSVQDYYMFPDYWDITRHPAFMYPSDRDYYGRVMTDIRLAIENANEQGVVITAGISNWAGRMASMFISSRRQVISAGATTATNEISAYNSTAFYYDIFAPGGDRKPYIYANVPGITQFDASSNIDDPICPFGASGYSSLTLGSAATPHIAGAAAIIKSYRPNATVEEVRRMLIKSTRPVSPNLVLIQTTGALLSLKRLKQNIEQ